MYKKILFNSLLCFTLSVLVSCATLPKKVAEDSTLVAGRVEMSYEGYDDVTLNGKKHNGIQVIVKELGKDNIFYVNTDKEGYFYLTRLKPNTPYVITGFKFTSPNGAGLEWGNFTFDLFTTADNTQITNLGTYCLKYDVKTNISDYKIQYHYAVRNHLEELEEDSEWLERKIVDHGN